MMETTLLSTSLSFIMSKVSGGNKTARLLKKYKKNIDRPLAAILTMNTVANTFGAAAVGAQAVTVFGEALFGIISAFLTLLVLVVSEIIPKTIGANYWREISLPGTRVIQVMIILTYPFLIFAKYITRLFSNKKNKTSFNREELIALAMLGMHEGVFEKNETQAISNIIKLRSLKIRSIMTPRTVIVAAPETMSSKEFATTERFKSYSRIPIYEDQLDNITGYVLKTDVLENVIHGKADQAIAMLKRPVITCYENFTLPKLFEQLIIKKEHMSVIVDEYGGLAGVATLEDVIETLLGYEILDEKDQNADMQQVAMNQWRNRWDYIDLNTDDKGERDKDEE